MVDRKELRKKLPYGYCKKIAKQLNVTPQVISDYFSYKTNSERVENAILKMIAKLTKEKRELLNQIQ